MPPATPSRSTRGRRPAPPRLPADLVRRSELLTQFARAVRGGPLVVVSGPPGAGATTLVAHWAADTTAEVVWVRAERALDDRSSFWCAIADDLGISVPDSGAVTFRTELVRRVAAAVGAVTDPAWRLVVVVDDAHVLRSVTLRADLAAVLDATRDLVVVLVGHEPLAAADPLAGLAPVAFDGATLAFSAREAAELVGHAVRATVAPGTVQRAAESVGGHAGILAAAARRLAREDRPTAELSVRSVRSVEQEARAWVDAVLPAGPLRRATEQLAVVERLPTALARALDADAHAVLSEAARLGLGRMDHATEAFTWVPSVLAALRRAADGRAATATATGFGTGADADDAEADDAARAVRAAGASTAALRAAVAWAAEHRDPVTGVDAALRLADLDALTAVLRAVWTDVAGPDAAVVARLLDAVPLRSAARHPLVLAAIARSAVAADRHHARASRASAAVVPAVAACLPDADPAEAVLLSAVDAQARRIAGDDRGARRASGAAERALAGLGPEERDRLAPCLPFVLQQIAATALAGVDVERALATLARIEPVAGPTGARQRAEATGLTALVHALIGEVTMAERLLAEPGLLDDASTLIARAVVLLDGGDAEAALRELGRVDPMAGGFEQWPIVLAVRVRAVSLLGRVTPADQLVEFDAEVERFRIRSAPTAFGARFVARARIRLLLAAGQLQRAEEALAALDPATTWTAAERAGLRLARDEPEPALDVVTGTLVRRPTEPRTTALLVLLRAVASWRAGDHATALRVFRAALDTLERTGMRGELLTVPRADLEALGAAASAAGDERAERWLDPMGGLRSVLPSVGEAVVLSERETVVLGLLAGTMSLPEVAAQLHVSVNTVKTQARSIYRKLGVNGRRAAVERAHELGVLVV